MSSQQLSRNEVSSLIRQVNSPSLYNRQLSSVCQVNGLKSTGVKAELQRRITTCECYIFFCYVAFDLPALHRFLTSLPSPKWDLQMGLPFRPNIRRRLFSISALYFRITHIDSRNPVSPT